MARRHQYPRKGEGELRHVPISRGSLRSRAAQLPEGAFGRTVRKRSSHPMKTIRWEAKMPPVNRLQIKEPRRGPGEIVEIDIVLWGRVLGRLKIFNHTILATVDYANSAMTEF